MNAPARPIRVFQVATGNVGSEMIRRIATQPDLELIGLHCYSPEKIGRDAGELAGIGPNGVKATGAVEEIIAASPDVLTFHGVFPDEGLYVKVLEAGINIVTTADWITGWHRDTNYPHPSGKAVTRLLAEACEKGGATFYGTGMNPGLNQILGVVCSADVSDIENVTTIESVDVSCHHSKDTWLEVGYGQPVDDPEIPQVPGHGGRGAPRRDAPGVADDPAHRPELEHQGLLHYSDQGRPVRLQQAHDLPQARRGPVQSGQLRLHRHDRHRHARPALDQVGGGGASRTHHQRRPAAARVRGAVQEVAGRSRIREALRMVVVVGARAAV
jgi:Dihydrodipicolinate reductase, N-terminus